jgi:hypothetical protein
MERYDTFFSFGKSKSVDNDVYTISGREFFLPNNYCLDRYKSNVMILSGERFVRVKDFDALECCYCNIYIKDN